MSKYIYSNDKYNDYIKLNPEIKPSEFLIGDTILLKNYDDYKDLDIVNFFINDEQKEFAHGKVKDVFVYYTNDENFIVNSYHSKTKLQIKSKYLGFFWWSEFEYGNYTIYVPDFLLKKNSPDYKPKNIIIYDDGEHKDLRNDPLYSHIFNLIHYYGIEWFFEFGERKGQVLNHIKLILYLKLLQQLEQQNHQHLNSKHHLS
jgi:hypothetical protein